MGSRVIKGLRVLLIPLANGPLEVEPLMAQGAFTDLVAAYSSPGRYYYTLQHIDLFAVAEPSAQHNLKAEIQSFAQLELMATKL